jgi:hypothetical protein
MNDIETDDDLAPARGILTGIILGALIIAAVSLAALTLAFVAAKVLA